MRLAKWLRVARQPAVLKRSAIVCFLVGSILVAVNLGPQLIAGAFSPTLLVQVVLTYLVPFVVSTATSVAALGPPDSAGHAPAGRD